MILNEAVTLMRELIFAKTKPLLKTIECMKFMKMSSRENRSSFGIQFLIEHGYNSFRRRIYIEYHKGKDWYICSNCKITIITVNQQKRKLMNRLLVASRTRPDIDLQFCLGKYEFSVTTPSLFSPDGSLHSNKDKSVIVEKLFKLQVDAEIESEPMDRDKKTVAIVDGKTFVNKVSIKKNHIRNCEEFASCFIDIIDKETAEYHEVHIVFHRYQKNSLKGNTRATRTKGYLAVHYKISDTTKIDHVQAKDFLSLIETKKRINSVS